MNKEAIELLIKKVEASFKELIDEVSCPGNSDDITMLAMNSISEGIREKIGWTRIHANERGMKIAAEMERLLPLMIAAPDLLKAVETMLLNASLRFMSDDDDEGSWVIRRDDLRRLRDLFAKVKGVEDHDTR